MGSTPNRHFLAVIACCVIAAATTAHAQQYRWVDGKGRVQYTDTPPPPGAKGVEKKNLNTSSAGSATEPYALQVAMKKAPVKLYTAPDAPGCAEARALLNERGIPFSEIAIASAAQMTELKNVSGGTIVPVMLVGGAVEKGFEAGSYHRALDYAGYPKPGVLRPRNQVAPLPKAPPPAPTPAVAAGDAPANPQATEPANATRQ